MSQVEPIRKASLEEADTFRQEVAGRIKQRLANERITIADARDGLQDCFVTSYLGGVVQGLEHFELRGPLDQIAHVTENLFRKRLRERGVSFEQPTLDALEGILEGMNRELHIDGLPAELKGVHEQVCSLLLAKASGDLPHEGDRSVIKAARQASVDPVSVPLRDAIAAYLDAFRAAAVDPSESAEGLLRRLGKLSRLIETLQEISA